MVVCRLVLQILTLFYFYTPKMLFFITIVQQYALLSRSKQFSSIKYEARQISLFYVVDAFFDLVIHHFEKMELLSLSNPSHKFRNQTLVANLKTLLLWPLHPIV